MDNIAAQVDAIRQHFTAELASAQARLDTDLPTLAAWATAVQASPVMQALRDTGRADLEPMIADLIRNLAQHLPAPAPAADPNAAMA